jgi:hypothetical protein
MEADGTVVLTQDDNDKYLKIDSDGEAVALEDNEVAITPGLEAFGDYNWIIHNLRLPTAANTNFWAPSKRMDEMPVPGQQYTQFIIRICKKRDGIMGEIVGARGISVTTHVLYVAGKITEATSPAGVVYKALTDSAANGGLALPTSGNNQKVFTEADNVLQDPFGELGD